MGPVGKEKGHWHEIMPHMPSLADTCRVSLTAPAVALSPPRALGEPGKTWVLPERLVCRTGPPAEQGLERVWKGPEAGKRVMPAGCSPAAGWEKGLQVVGNLNRDTGSLWHWRAWDRRSCWRPRGLVGGDQARGVLVTMTLLF